MNCKPGDLAYVVFGAQVGLVVEVIEPEIPFDDGSPAWAAKSSRPLRTLKRKSRRPSQATEFRVRDSWLRPISGVLVGDHIDDEVGTC